MCIAKSESVCVTGKKYNLGIIMPMHSILNQMIIWNS